jgi:hypothetical protein
MLDVILLPVGVALALVESISGPGLSVLSTEFSMSVVISELVWSEAGLLWPVHMCAECVPMYRPGAAALVLVDLPR